MINSMSEMSLEDYKIRRTVSETSHYNILGVNPNVPFAVIKTAFAKLAVMYGSVRTPDKETEFQQIIRAYLVLSDPEKRKTYDEGGEQAIRNKWSGEIFFDEMDFATRITNTT